MDTALGVLKCSRIAFAALPWATCRALWLLYQARRSVSDAERITAEAEPKQDTVDKAYPVPFKAVL